MKYINKGTLSHRNAPLPRPTDLDPLYPDPWGHWQEVEDERFTRQGMWVGRAIGLIAFVALVLVMWRVYG